MESSRLVRAIFVVLVVATVAAFYGTQRLKQEVPLVLRFAVGPDAFSPNGDRVRDKARLGFDLSETADVTFGVIDPEGKEIRRLVDDRRLQGDKRWRFAWDGRDNDGAVVADGIYRMRFVRRREGRSIDSFKEVRVDTKPPRVRIASAKPGVFDPGDGERGVEVTYEGPSNGSPEFRVYRTEGGPTRIVRRFRGNVRSGTWDGTVISGDSAVDGDYAFQVRVRDKAGNQAISPRRTPTARNTRPGAGAAIRRLTLEGPLDVLSAGSVAELDVGPSERRVRFVLSRLGDPKPVRQGVRSAGRLRIGIPPQARTGMYVVRVRARGRRAVWPIAVAGLPVNRRAASRPRPLVVLPTITWQGENDYDSDLDGFPDTLENKREIPIRRPFQAGRMPRGFTQEVAPLLEFLDRERLGYDLTTDVSLAKGEGPSLGEAPGVAIAGTATWLTRSVRDRLREEVDASGLKVVSFGRKSLGRQVELEGDVLRDPSPRRPDDLFGERTRLFETDPSAPLSADGDEIGLFEGTDALFGDFSLFERSLSLPEGAQLLSAAGRAPDAPAFVAYRLGEGLVIRTGTPQWATALDESTLSLEVPRITENIWRRISRSR